MPLDQIQRRMEGQIAAARDWRADPDNVAWADHPFIGPMLEQGRGDDLMRLTDPRHQDRQREAFGQTVGLALGALQGAQASRGASAAGAAQPVPTDQGPNFPDMERRPGAFGTDFRPGAAYLDALRREQAFNRRIAAAKAWKESPEAMRDDPFVRNADQWFLERLNDPAYQAEVRRRVEYEKRDALEWDRTLLREETSKNTKTDVGANALMDERRGGPWGGKPFTDSMRDDYELLNHYLSNPTRPLPLNALREAIHLEARRESAVPHWRPEFSNGGSVQRPALATAEFSDLFDEHDKAYYTGTISREEADRRLYDGMIARANAVADPARRNELLRRAEIIDLGVRAGGGFFYKRR